MWKVCFTAMRNFVDKPNICNLLFNNGKLFTNLIH